MKKWIVGVLLVFTAGLILSSCQSSKGPKCPGMYSKAETVECQKRM